MFSRCFKPLTGVCRCHQARFWLTLSLRELDSQCKHSFSSKIYFPPCLGNLMMHRKYLKKKFPFPVTSLQGCHRIDFFTTWENVFSSKLYLRFIFRHSRFLPGPQTIFWSESAISNPKAIAIFQGNVTSNRMCSGKAQNTFLYFDTQPL